jgi:hypothetical protein
LYIYIFKYLGGNELFLCIKKDLTGESAAITSLIIIFPQRGEYQLPGKANAFFL